MNDFGFNEYDALFRQAASSNQKQPSALARFADPVLSSTGAVIGFVLGAPAGPAGMASGASAGYKAGHAIGDTVEAAATKDANPKRIMQNVTDAYGGFKSFQTPQTAITPNAGVNPPLPEPSFSPPQDVLNRPRMPFQGINQNAALSGMSPQALLELYMQNPQAFQMPTRAFAPYIGMFAAGGMVPDARTLEMLSQYARAGQPDYAALAETARSMAGERPEMPQAPEVQTASHPTLEAILGALPTLAASLPKPADPRNTKAIGAWAPFAANVAALPAAVAQSRRGAANAQAAAGYDDRMKDYGERAKAYDQRVTTWGDQLIQNAKPVAGQAAAARVPVMDSDWQYMLGKKALPKAIQDEYAQNGGTLSAEGYKSFQAAVDNLRAKDRADGAGSRSGLSDPNLVRLSDEALNQHAVYHAVTGDYILKARDAAGQNENRRVSNLVARMFPGRNLAQARAAFRGNEKSRQEIQLSSDGIEAFAAAAAKNLKMIEEVVASIPDTGSPVLNMPVRKFEASLRGDPKMAAFHALRMSLNTEYARLTQAMKLTGVGLSVDAQREVRNAISENATVGQVLAAYTVLANESGNRAASMQEMLSIIDNRMQIQAQINAERAAASGAPIVSESERPPLESFVREGR